MKKPESIRGLIRKEIEKYLLKEYNEKLLRSLADKFKKENPSLEDKVIKWYIDRFSQLKNSPKIVNKDITKYTWKELERVVDSQPVKEKDFYKDEPTATNADLVYNKNGLRIYKGTSKRSCIKYGSGYSWCISSRGEGNMYGYYRLEDGGTPYFVFDDNRSKEQNEEGEFVDPGHAIVIFVFREETYDDDDNPIYKNWYMVTTANNDGDNNHYSFQTIERDFPKLKGLENLFVPIAPSKKETLEQQIRKKYNSIIEKMNHEIWENEMTFSHYEDIEVFDPNILNKSDQRYEFKAIGKPDGDFNEIVQKRFIKDEADLEKNLEDFKRLVINVNDPEDAKNLEKITYQKSPITPVEEEYYKKLTDLYYQYKGELNKLNIE